MEIWDYGPVLFPDNEDRASHTQKSKRQELVSENKLVRSSNIFMVCPLA